MKNKTKRDQTEIEAPHQEARETRDLEKRHRNLQRREDREAAISRLHEQARTGLFDESGQRTWNRLGTEEQEMFMTSRKLPKGFQFHHFENLADHSENMGHGPLAGVITDRNNHILGYHGGDTTAPTSSDQPKDPDWEKNWGRQEVDATDAERRRLLGMTENEADTEDIDAQLKKDYPDWAAELDDRAKKSEARAEASLALPDNPDNEVHGDRASIEIPDDTSSSDTGPAKYG